MTTKELLGALLRRWYVLVGGLLVTVAICFGATQVVPASYTTAVSVLLLPPASPLAEGNPYRALAGLQLAADVLARAVTDTSTTNEIAPPAGSASYAVVRDGTTSGPILLVTTEDTSEAGALATLRAVLDTMPKTLADLQTEAGAPPESLLTMSVIANTDVAEKSLKSLIRAVIVAATVGIGATLLLAAAVDGSMRRRDSNNGGFQSDPVVTSAPGRAGRPRRATASDGGGGPGAPNGAMPPMEGSDGSRRRRIGLAKPADEGPAAPRRSKS